MPLVDSHCHPQSEKFSADFREVITRSLAAGMKLVVPSFQFKTSQQAVALAHEYEGLYAAVGLHPIHVNDEYFDRPAYEQLARDSKVVAIGETGLDRYRIIAETAEQEDAIFNKQKEVFNQHFELAEALNKTVIMHCREAYDELLELLEARTIRLPLVIHCFIGNSDQAKRFLMLNCFIGFTGVITFKNCAPELLTIVREAPLNRILIETDSPYLAPDPHRGGRNEPLYVEFVARKIAELKGLSYEEVVEATGINARSAFGI